MKSIILIAVSVVFFALASCHKAAVLKPVSSDISASIDGVNEDFNAGDSVRNIGSTGIYVTGANDANFDRIIFYISSNSAVAPGTYYTPGPNHSDASVQIMFQPAGSGSDYYYTYYTEPYETDPGFQYLGSITVTTVSDTHIEGTFSGSLIWVNSVTPGTTNPLKTKTISNGKFNIYLH